MKKNIKNIFTIILVLIVFTTNNTVKADSYNGGGTSKGPSTGGGDCPSFEGMYCPYGNHPNLFMAVKVSLAYVSDGKIQKVKKLDGSNVESRYIANQEMFDNWLTKKELIKGEYSNISVNLAKYFGADTNGCEGITNDEKFNEAFKEIFGIAKEQVDFSNNSIKAMCDNTKQASEGYRIILEPVLAYKTLKKGKIQFEYLTPKEISSKIKNNPNLYTAYDTGTTKYKEIKRYFYLSKNDVGIAAYNDKKCEGIEPSEMAKTTNGCGYNIIDITKPVTTTCYVPKIEGGNLTCKNTNQNNTAYFTEKFDKETCSKIENEEERNRAMMNTQNGKKMGETNTCTLYCMESAFASFPGSIKNTIELKDEASANTYFAWPGVKDLGATNLMKMSSTLKCTLVNKSGKSCTKTDKDSLTNTVISNIKDSKQFPFEAQLTGGDNKALENVTLEQYNIDIKSTDTGSNKFNVTKEVYFKIPSGKNRLYNKEKDKVEDCEIGTCKDTDDVDDRGEGVISFKVYEDKKNTLQYLYITGVKLGTSNQFGNMIDEYKCTYQFTYGENDTPNTCIWYSENTWNVYKACYLNALENIQKNEKYKNDRASGFRKLVFNTDIGITNIDEAIQKIERDITNEGSILAYNQCKSHLSADKKQEIDLTSCIKEQQSNGYTEKKSKTICESKLCSACVSSYGVPYDLTACMSTGNSYRICEHLYCPDETCPDDICEPKCTGDCKWNLITQEKTKYTYKKICGSESCGELVLACPGGDTDMNNPEGCIKDKLSYKLDKNMSVAEGLTKKIITANDVKAAFAACEPEVCPMTGKIVYRTIDLNNPFPGKFNNKNVKEFCNGDCKGRIPGKNWNSIDIVKNKILNARNKKGYELYNKNVEPLYIIKLTPTDIKKIRDYNNDNKYSDFNLNCTTDDNDSKCISKFLHEGEYSNIVTGGRCKNINDSTSFDECYREDK